MTSFISAGHHLKDPGASANGRYEKDETIKFRNKVLKVMMDKHPEIKVISDDDSETLSQYLRRIQSGSGSVVIEFHLDASNNIAATGTTGIVAASASENSKAFAKELVDATSCILGIHNRGVIPETQSARGRLGLMRENGIVALLELCFITNNSDMEALDDPCRSNLLAETIASIIAKYDKLIQ